MNNLKDLAAERAVLAAFCQYGLDALLECSFLDVDHFTDTNKIHFKCIESCLQKGGNADLTLILSTAKEMGCENVIATNDEISFIRSLFTLPIQTENIAHYYAKLAKLKIARDLEKTLRKCTNEITNITGEESIADLLSIIERPFLEITSSVQNTDNKVELISQGIDEHIQNLIDNPNTMPGLSTGFPEWDNAIGGGLRRKCVDLIAARTKAQPLTSNILTIKGWKKMGDIKVGELLCHPNGGYSIVKEIIPHGEKECFEFNFNDGSKTEATEDHLWKIKSGRWKDYKVLSWKEIKHEKIKENDRYKWQLPLVKHVDFPEVNLPINPYILGFLIGDGSLTMSGVSFTTADQEIINLIEKRIPENLKVEKLKGEYKYSIRSTIDDNKNEISKAITNIKLRANSHDKFVPIEYMNSSYGQRLEFLRGLLDADGGPTDNGKCIEYTTVSLQLANDVKLLISSIGGKTKIKPRYTSFNGKRFLSYRILISTNNNTMLFNLTRKKELCIERTKPHLKRRLVSVASTGIKECQCIRIDNEDGLYITDDYIVTHNCGKSLLANSVAIHVSRDLNVPVLYLDTEMDSASQKNRLLANLSNVKIKEISNGNFGLEAVARGRVIKAAETLKVAPYHYINISGQSFDNILATTRKWIYQHVGFESDGRTKDCLIIYDYLKLMSSESISSSMQEYQVLGFQITQLHNFCVKYDIPCLSFVQTNRDGITKESTDIVSGSDRLAWLCTSLTAFKEKSPDEQAEDRSHGLERPFNRKLVPIVSRYGGGVEDGNYINVLMEGEYTRLTEGPTRNNTKKWIESKNKAFDKLDDTQPVTTEDAFRNS